MKTRIKNIEECTKRLFIEVPLDIVQQVRDTVYKGIKKVAKVPGFRVGSVPLDLLEKPYARDAQEEMLKRLIPEGYRKAVENHKITPLGMPRIQNVAFEPGKPLIFEAEVDTRPVIKLRNYKGIKIRKTRISAAQQEVDEALVRIRNLYATYSDVARPVQKGDYAVCNVEVTVNGKLVTKKNSNMWIQADKEASLLGMGEELVGLTGGQTKEIETKLPDTYPDKQYAGKEAKFTVTVNEVKEKKLPELNDDFIKGLNMNAESVEGLKQEIESQILVRKEGAARREMENQILQVLLRENRFSVPSSLVSEQKEILARRLTAELEQKQVAKEEISRQLTELDGKLAQEAGERVRSYFLLDDIASREKITVDQKDLDGKLESIAASTGRTNEEVKKYYEKENLLDGLIEKIKEDKVLALLLKEADISESV
jgi:trigger factor